MATSTLRIPADTEQVRLARLVATAAARRAGCDEQTVDDVRLAVGEAVARAVVRSAPGTEVEVRLIDEPDGFGVEVQDTATEDTDEGFAMAVITGLVPEAATTAVPQGGQILSLRWVVGSA